MTTLVAPEGRHTAVDQVAPLELGAAPDSFLVRHVRNSWQLPGSRCSLM
jgi:hypothetical protein